jgi:lipid-binding SYLF domain-containing protein
MRRRFLLGIMALALMPVVAAPAARAQSDQQQVVNEAVGVVQSFQQAGGNYPGNVRSLMHRARAVIIVPNLVKAGFIFGAQGGTGVLLVHGRGGWSQPAFYNMGAASFGFQAGVEVSKVMLIVMNDRALNLAITNAQLNLGAQAGLAIANIGGATEGTVTSAGADIYTVSISSGLYGGLSLQGGVIGPNPDWNAAYYGAPLTTEQIVYGRGKMRQRGTMQLRRALGHL